MSTQPLEWYQNHPYVKVWREQDSNSYLSTVDALNSSLNIDVNNPITLSRVDYIVNQYLTLLARDIKVKVTEEKIPSSEIGERFHLNRTEVKYIVNKSKKRVS